MSYDVPNSPLLDLTGSLTPAWAQWVQRVHQAAQTLEQSGITANRPKLLLWIGRFYFDTTLNKPIWIKQVKPAILWIDAAGNTV